MNITNLINTRATCEETQKMKNRADLTRKHLSDNKALAIKMLKKDKSIALISRTTGIGRNAISKYKSQLSKVL